MTLPPFDQHEPLTASVPPERRPPAPTPASRPKNRGAWLFVVGAALLFATAFVLLAIVSLLVGETDVGVLGDSVVVMTVEGPIVDSRDFIETLHSYQDDANVKGIVVRLNTPGGGITPSQDIYDEILAFREESGKPVVASMGSVAASGGYYIAAACDYIVASRGTVTGSIGVIAQWMNMRELVEWAKMDPTTFKSGERKDLGNPYREMSQEEKEFYQAFIDELHGQFVDAVAQGRDMERAQVASLADGRIFTGESAMEKGLVDELGNLWDAISITGSRAGMGDDPRFVYPAVEDPGLLDLLFSTRGFDKGVIRNLIRSSHSPFEYRMALNL